MSETFRSVSMELSVMEAKVQDAKSLPSLFLMGALTARPSFCREAKASAVSSRESLWQERL